MAGKVSIVSFLAVSENCFLTSFLFSFYIFCLIFLSVDFHRSASDYLKGGDKKLFGTPLVTYTSENPLSGADIDTTVSRILSPLTRTYSSANAHRGKENGFVSDPIDEQLNSCSFVNSEENTSSQELSFQLFLTDEKLLNYKQIEKDSLIKHGQVCRVLVEWTDKENELYDGSYLKDLPEVHKAGFTVKKTRQEAISLFSCLEAFLMEEPLGPDDMW